MSSIVSNKLLPLLYKRGSMIAAVRRCPHSTDLEKYVGDRTQALVGRTGDSGFVTVPVIDLLLPGQA